MQWKIDKGNHRFKQISYARGNPYFGFNKSIKIENHCNSVKHITLWFLNPTNKSIESIVDAFPNAEEILVHHTNVQSLEGIEKLKNLRTLRIDYGRYLQSVKEVNQCEQIERVQVELSYIPDFPVNFISFAPPIFRPTFSVHHTVRMTKQKT